MNNVKVIKRFLITIVSIFAFWLLICFVAARLNLLPIRVIEVRICQFIPICPCSSDACLPDGITFSNQSEIDNFKTNYPCCKIIKGSVKISGDDINNLFGLDELIKIQGHLDIRDNENLASLSGLNSLKKVGLNIRVYNNSSLRSMDALNRLEVIGGDLDVRDNVVLVRLPNLERVTEIGRGLLIKGNHTLGNLEGLEQITFVKGRVYIWLNQGLKNLKGLDQLHSMEGRGLRLEGNHQLTDLGALRNVTSINQGTGEGRLVILANDILSSLAGLENIQYQTIDSLIIKDNVNLSYCELENICDYIQNGGATLCENSGASENCVDKPGLRLACVDVTPPSTN
ncbi:hypothetical protein QQ008_09010 [Fulvivirgaceae bacterium BMA10]|uniref:Receptor L-domain domain-containing protein n=1 Tax=Splendidivirga corallicola TaxID=3051826 RepID=A0ABT8KLA4_9BACT|nr:hypothetical protein [Fulvivirgaceae bacterium BMA10]